MPRMVQVELNRAKALVALGSLYHNSADAIKEYISNALDEWRHARERGEMGGPCQVSYFLEKDSITISYNAPGMDEAEFEEALKRVVDSPKRSLAVPQIGYLGIGLWAFNQIGGKAVFYSKKTAASPTLKVVLHRGQDQAELSYASQEESRSEPGMTIVITRLFHDPTKPLGPLAPERLKHLFAERFDAYLRAGDLKLTICQNGKTWAVEPLKLETPPLGGSEQAVSLPSGKSFSYQLWFDPSGSGKVSIRHTGVVVLEDLKAIPAYGLEKSIYASGFLRGYIDADFLKPLPARALFQENQDWLDFLAGLERLGPEIESQIRSLRQQRDQEQKAALLRKAFRMAREILNSDKFQDLELPRGLWKRVKAEPAPTRASLPRSRRSGNGHRSSPATLVPREVSFEESLRHSRLAGNTIEINTANPDYLVEAMASPQEQLEYYVLVIGKEAIAYNDKSGSASEFLEKLISYVVEVEKKLG